MPSDERITAALAALRPQISAYRIAVEAALEKARKALSDDRAENKTENALGAFAAGRIDPGRFARISEGLAPLDAASRGLIQRATEVLERISSSSDQEFVVRIESGRPPTTAIRERMTALGAAFAAATVIDLVRRRAYDSQKHSLSLDGYPFERWSSAERKAAPPLVIDMDGPELEPSEIAPFIDGRTRLVFVMNASAAPAALARLISPGVLVMQAGDDKSLQGLSDFDGPAVAAIMNGAEARFVHDPRLGTQMWQRLRVSFMPPNVARKSVGSRSAWQVREDVALLRALITPPSLSRESGTPSLTLGADDAAERIASWLVGQAAMPDGVT